MSVRLGPNCSPSAAEEVWSDMGEAFSCSWSAAIRDLRSGLLLVDVREFENRPVENVLSLAELGREVASDRTSEGAGLPSRLALTEASLDMPGSPLLPEATLSDPASSLLLLYAAFPMPLSAVCLNHDGSREPNDAAI